MPTTSFFVVSQMLPTYFSSSVTGPLKTPGKYLQILHTLPQACSGENVQIYAIKRTY